MQRHFRELGSFGLMFSLLLAPLGCGGGSSGPPLIQGTACTGTFNACGGDPTGTWDVVAVCVDGDLVSAFNTGMAAQYSACGNTFTAANLALAGSVTYGAGKFSFDATTALVESLAYTPACVSALSSGVALSASVCGQMQQNLNKETGTKGNCTYTGTNCNCQATVTLPNTSSGTYTVSGSTIIESGGSSYDFCVNGDTMTQREAVEGNAYGVTQMKKR
jgi:hypothetical protein